MEKKVIVHPQVRSWLEHSILQPYVSELRIYFQRGRYSVKTQHDYLYSIAHFARWVTRAKLALTQLDERAAARFIDAHLSRCNCAEPVRRSRIEASAALRHLLEVLRGCGAIVEDRGDGSPLQAELTRFDQFMEQVKGLAPNTREQRLRIARHFLKKRFASRVTVPAQIQPVDIREFVLGRKQAYSAGTIRVIGGALRCYLRFRSVTDDSMRVLLDAVPRVANWRLATLPEVLSDQEVQKLLGSFDHVSSTVKRDYAMVRCLTDLGLRASEVVQLRLPDINWSAGTVRLIANKSRRVDILPLPAETGKAIAEYLHTERPQTTNRALFVRYGAPFDKPIQAGVVRLVVRKAYRRCGWSHSRVHILRHSLASRLLLAGTPLKEIADILRHRSFDTSAIYTKIDKKRLSAVAMPWPGRSL